MTNNLSRYVSEIVGTFMLVFAGTGAIVVNEVSGGTVTHVGIALTFGLVILAVISMIGDVSGAHINPAVTLGFWLRGKFSSAQVLPYIACQVAGAFAASGVLKILFPANEMLGTTLPAGSEMQSFILETLLTWMLVLAVFCVSAGAKEKGITAGIAIGAVIAFEAMFGGPISGASMNPARSLAPAVVSGHLTSLWIYIAAPLLGSVLAVGTAALIWGREK